MRYEDPCHASLYRFFVLCREFCSAINSFDSYPQFGEICLLANNIRRANACDPSLKLLNEEIASDIQKHKQNLCKEHLDAHWDHRHDTHIRWKTIHGISNRVSPPTLNTAKILNS